MSITEKISHAAERNCFDTLQMESNAEYDE